MLAAERGEEIDRSMSSVIIIHPMSKIRVTAKMCVEMHCDFFSYVKFHFCPKLDEFGCLGFWRRDARKRVPRVYTEGLLCSYGAFIPIGRTVFKFHDLYFYI